jgi:hypothetical protein
MPIFGTGCPENRTANVHQHGVENKNKQLKI